MTTPEIEPGTGRRAGDIFADIRQQTQQRLTDLSRVNEQLLSPRVPTAIPSSTQRPESPGWRDFFRAAGQLQSRQAPGLGLALTQPELTERLIQPPQPDTQQPITVGSRQEASSILTETNRTRSMVRENLTEQSRMEWRLAVTNVLEAGYQAGLYRDVNDVLRRVQPPDGLRDDDISFAAEALRQAQTSSDVALPNPLTQDEISRLISDIGQEHPRTIMGIGAMTGTEIRRRVREWTLAELPVGMSQEELNGILAASAFSDEDIEQLTSLRNQIEEFESEWAKHQARRDVLQEEFADIELDELARLVQDRKASLLWSEPGLALMVPINWWRRQVESLSAITVLGYSAIDIDIGGIRRDRESDQRIRDFHRRFDEARRGGESTWGALGEAYSTWDTNGFNKFVIETVSDPTTLFGFGLYAKILRPIPKVGIHLAGLETGYIKATDQLFLNLQQGLVRTGGRTVDMLVGEGTREVMRSLKAGIEAFDGGLGPIKPFYSLTSTEVAQRLRTLAAHARANPMDTTPGALAGRAIVTRAPLDTQDLRELGNLMSTRVSDDALSTIDTQVGQYTIGLGGRTLSIDETAELLAKASDEGLTDRTLQGARQFLELQSQKLDDQVNALIDPTSSSRTLGRITTHYGNILRATETSRAFSQRVGTGAMTGYLTRAGAVANLLGASKLASFTHGFARNFLLFTGYPVFNAVEGVVKTSLASINPVYRGSPVDELAANTAGLVLRTDIFDQARGFVQDLGPIQASSRIVPERLPGMSNNTYRRLQREARRGWLGWVRGIPEEIFVKMGGRLGLRQQANYLLRQYQRHLIENHPDLVLRVQSTVDRHLDLLEGFTDQQKQWVRKEALSRSLSDYSRLVDLPTDFTPAKISAEKLNNLIQQQDVLFPSVRDYLMQESDAGRLIPALDRAISNAVESTYQEVLASPELVRQQLHTLVEEALQTPLDTPESVLSMAKLLQEAGEFYGSSLTYTLRVSRSYAQRLTNPNMKSDFYTDLWNDTLLPFMDSADDDLLRLGQYLRGRLHPPTPSGGHPALRAHTLSRIRNFVGNRENLWFHGGPAIEEGDALNSGFLTSNLEEALDFAEAASRTGELGDAFVHVVDLSQVDEAAIRTPSGTPSNREILDDVPILQSFDIATDADRFLRGAPRLTMPDEQVATLDTLLTQVLNHTSLIRRTRTRQHDVETTLLAQKPEGSTDSPTVQAWWTRFYDERDRVWRDAESALIESKVSLASTQTRLGTDPVSTLPRVQGRFLTPSDIGRLYGVVPQEISRTIFRPEFGLLRNKEDWVALTWRRVQDLARRSGTTPELEGYTKDGLGFVYDLIASEMRGSTSVGNLAKPHLDQLDTLKREVTRFIQRNGAEWPDAGEEALLRYGQAVRDDLSSTEVASDLWQGERQKALDSAFDQLRLDWPVYDAPTALNTTAKTIFPFWTYETHRLFWLARLALEKPGIYASGGRYSDYTDQGYISIPGSDTQVNFLRGSIFMGGFRRLVNRDFPDYYDKYPGFSQTFDQLSRFGFYPNILVSGFLSLAGSKATNRPQYGELVPPLYQTVLESFVAANPDSAPARFIVETLLPNRFRDYIVAQVIGQQGGPGIRILDKLNAGIALTAEEQSWWDQGQAGTARFNIINTQAGILRLRPRERVEFEKATQQLYLEHFGVPITVQEEARKYGLHLSDYLPMTPADRELYRELEGADQWRGVSTYLRESEVGQVQAHTRTFWDDIRTFRESEVQPAKLDLDRRFLLPEGHPDHINLSTWEQQLRQQNSRVISRIESTQDNPKYAKTLVTFEDRVNFALEHGETPLLLHPIDELINLYMTIQPVLGPDPESGETRVLWEQFFTQRRVFKETLPPQYREEILSIINRHDTPLERVKEADYVILQPYFDANDLVLQSFSEAEQETIHAFNASDDPERKETLREVLTDDGATKLISTYQTRLSGFRQDLRDLNPALDARLALWRGTTPRTEAASELVQSLRREYGFTPLDSQ